MEKILTVSVAAYNVEKYIRKTLDSLIVPEILDKLEVLVVDDGSTDNTLAIAKEYEEKYPNTFRAVHKENGGYGSTINYSVIYAKGKYFKQLDGDDWFHTDMLLSFVELLERVDTDCVYTQRIDCYETTDKQFTVGHLNYLTEGKYKFCDTEFIDIISMHETTIKTKILQEMNLNITEHCFYTDIEFVSLPIPYLQNFYVWHSPIYMYRLGREGQSVSVVGWKKHYKELETVFWRILNIYNALDESEVHKRQLLMYWLRVIVVGLLRRYCVLLFSKEHFKEIRNFERKLRSECPEVITQAKKCSKLALLLLGTHCISYPIVRILFNIKLRLEHKV